MIEINVTDMVIEELAVMPKQIWMFGKLWEFDCVGKHSKFASNEIFARYRNANEIQIWEVKE